MEIKSILIKDTTREERIRIVQEGLNQCGGAMAVTTWAADRWRRFMSRISMERRNCGS